MVGKSLSNNMQALVANSELGVRLAMALGRYIPPGLGYPMARVLADYIARRQNWGVVRGARLNQWMVSGQQFSKEELDKAVQLTLRNQARSLYDLYRFLAWPEKMKDRMVVPQVLKEFIEYSKSPVPGQGKLVVGIHASNFDYALYTLVRYGARLLLLTLPTLGGGYQRQFELRRKAGLEVVSSSVSSFRLAVDRLKAGGGVLTGIDRPLDNPKHWPVFFGHPAPLPVHYVHIALRADVPVVLLAVKMDPDGIYHIQMSEPIEMKHNPNRNLEIVQNAEVVLSVAEHFISQKPQQWAMFFPVWPDLIETVPGEAG